jgi:hypothetical protein
MISNQKSVKHSFHQHHSTAVAVQRYRVLGCHYFFHRVIFSKWGFCDFQISKFWVRSFIPWPQITGQKCHQIYSTVKFVEQNFHFPILSRNLYGRYLLNSKFINFEYAILKKEILWLIVAITCFRWGHPNFKRFQLFTQIFGG